MFKVSVMKGTRLETLTREGSAKEGLPQPLPRASALHLSACWLPASCFGAGSAPFGHRPLTLSKWFLDS